MITLIKLPFTGVLEPVLKRLTEPKLVFVRGGLGSLACEFALGEKGPPRAGIDGTFARRRSIT